MIQTVVDRANNNHAPTINTFLSAFSARAGAAFNFNVPANTITDPDVWDSITYSAKLKSGAALPAWLSFDSATRTFTGTPGTADVGSFQFVLWGTDNYGSSAGEFVTVNVGAANRVPVLATALPDQTVAQGASYSYVVPATAFTDPDAGDTLSYSATLADGSALPAWLAFNPSTRTFTGIPTSTGTVSVKVTAKDTGNLTATDIFDIVVNVQNLTLTGTAGVDTLNGGSGNDTLSGLAGNDTLNDAGDDRLDGGVGNDTMRGGLGNDTYVADATTDIITENLNEGTDTVETAITFDLTNIANVENLTLLGTGLINATGNTLGNTLTGNSAVNTLSGGAGDDTYFITSGDIVTEATGAGTDTVNAGFTYTLATNAENLILTGTSAINGTGNTLANRITGNSANNTLNGGTGLDTLIGGLGNDTYTVDNTADMVTENLNEGTDLVQSSAAYTLLANVENLTLTGTGLINGTGNALGNTITGNSAVNTLTGGVGDDAYFITSGDIIVEALNEDTETANAGFTYTLAANVENLILTGTTAINGTGNALNNILTGNSAVNTLTGLAGDDTYFITSGDIVTEAASAGTDRVNAGFTTTLAANVENLTLTGTGAINGTGNSLLNLLLGNGGANILAGGLGNDTLTGGSGADQFLFNTAINAATNKDVITDFSVVDDTLRLENAIFTKFTTAGALTAGTFVSGAGAKALDANDYLIYNATTGTLSYDADGNGVGAQVDIVILTGIPALTTADFLIV